MKKVRAKKSLGQNFLTSRKIAERIALSSPASKVSTVLEIGPGKGILTRELLARFKKVIAIEKDRDLFSLLEGMFDEEIKEGKLSLRCADILLFDLETIPDPYHVVANIPYNITGILLRHFLTTQNQPQSCTFLVQKEVAERIVAKSGKESLLSLSVKVYGKPEIALSVKKRFFKPVPKVDSAVIVISNISRKNFASLEHEKRFFEIIRAGFKHPRKQVRNNLKDILSKEKILEWLEKENLLETTRAEDIHFSSWLSLTEV